MKDCSSSRTSEVNMPDQKNQTDIYHLPLYTDGDKPNLRDQYNRSMDLIDKTMNKQDTDISSAQQTANNAVASAAQAQSKADKNESLLHSMGVDSTDEGKSLTNSIANAKNTADSAQLLASGNHSALQALTADTTAKAANLLSAINGKASGNDVYKKSEVYTKSESDNRFVAKDDSQPILLTIGDSYATNDDHSRAWPYPLASQLGYNLKNFAVAGAGYIPTNSLFSTQLTNAINDNSYNHSLVKLIVIGGSRNSNDGYDGRVGTAAADLFSRAKAAFPSARIIAIPLLWDHTTISSYWRYQAGEILEAAALAGVESIPWAWTWNMGIGSSFDGNNIHPNSQGTGIIVNYIMQYLRGNYNGRYVAAVIRPQNNPAAWNVCAIGTAGSIHYQFMARSGITPTDLTSIKGLPEWAWGDSDETNSGRTWATAITNGANNATLFKVNNDGTCGIQGFTINPSGTPNGEAGVSFSKPW